MNGEPLCFRTFSEIVRPRMNKKSKIKNLTDEKVNIKDGTGVFVCYSLLLDSILSVAIKERDTSLPDVSGTMTTQLKKGNAEVHEKIIEITQRKSAFKEISYFFAVNLIPNIMPNSLNIVLDAIDVLVQEDTVIGKTMKKNLKKDKNDKTPADYLAKVFMIAVCNGKNKKVADIKVESCPDNVSSKPYSKNYLGSQ